MSDIVQKLKEGNIFWKIPMKIPVNRHYYSLVTFYCGEGWRSLRIDGLKGGGGVDDPPDQTGGKSVSWSLGGIDAPALTAFFIR